MKFAAPGIFGFSLALTLGAAGAVQAQEVFPNRFIRWVLPFSAGSGQDILARQIAPKLQERVGQPIVVDNKAGAGGLIGFEYIAKAKPDGYEIMMGNNSMLILSAIRPTPYDPLKDFTPVMQLGVGASMVMVHGSVPVSNLSEFVAYSRANPGKMNYASPAIGTFGHLATELFKMISGANMVHIPHKGIVAGFNGLVAGDVHFMMGVADMAIPHVKSGKLKAVASSGARRAPIFPDVPTLVELGYKDYNATLWYGLFVPAGTRADIVTRLHTEYTRVLGEQALRDDLLKRGVEVVTATGPELGAVMRSEMTTWQNVIKVGNIKPE